ncbi:VCBS repeat-containing protein [Planctomycetota bacterium]|nr:VCBS repeat-containing protein [Planctomycetota bacterium]
MKVISLTVQLCFVTVLAPSVSAQTFGGAQEIAFASVLDLIAADVDGDGFVDVISSGREGPVQTDDARIQWWRNVGGGAFESPALILNQLEPGYIECADMDGDADTDLVFWDASSPIYWFENLGQGVFAAESSIATGAAKVLDLVDLDADGFVDLLAYGYPNQGASIRELFWIPNLGAGTFSAPQIIGTPSREVWLTTGDIDGDLDLDVVVSSRGVNATYGTLEWFGNLGGGVFSGSAVIDSALRFSGPVGVADFDADGRQDIAVYRIDNSGTFNTEQVKLFWNEGGGSWQPSTTDAP